MDFLFSSDGPRINIWICLHIYRIVLTEKLKESYVLTVIS